LVLAVAIGAAGYLYLRHSASLARSQIEASAGERLLAGQPAVAQHIVQTNAAAIATARAVASTESIVQSMDERGRPTAESLELALAALHRAQPLEAERPALLALFGGGAAGRYRLGQSNRFDPDQSAFAALGESGSSARSAVATLEGQTYRLALVPFEDSKASGRGLVALGYPLDDAYAKSLAQGSGVEVVLLTGDKVIGSSLSPIERGDLSGQDHAHKETFGFGDLSGDHFVLTDLVPPLARYLKLPVGTRGHRYEGRPLPLTSVAESSWGKPDKPLAVDSATEIILAVKTLDGYSLLADEQRMLLAGLALLLLLAFILIVTATNPAKGLERVAAASEKMVLEGGDLRAPTDHMSRIARRIAIAVNALAGRLEATPAPPTPATASRTISQELSGSPARQPEPEPMPSPREPAGSVDAFLSNPPPPSGDTDPFGRPLPPRPAPASGRSMTTTWGIPENAPTSDQTVIAPMPEALIRATTRSPSSPPPSTIAEPAPARSATIAPTPAPSGGGDEAHYQQIYREFVSTRERCGEPADGLTFEKFAAKLKKNQEQLVAKYSCRSVRFQVYVKDGKAALKATPVR
jgi:hypothetical protein